MTNENVERWANDLTNRINKLIETPSRLHNQVFNIAESCADQLKDLMPGCHVRVIVEQADLDAHRNQEVIAIGSGVSHMTKVALSDNSEKDYLLLTTDTNND